MISKFEPDPESGCWIWQGRQHKGYGKFGSTTAHRAVYEQRVGPVPDGLELDHTCLTPLCVNPEHLEPVTRDENMRRRVALKTHCVNGHEFTPENTSMRGGTRLCLACRSAKAKRRRQGAAA